MMFCLDTNIIINIMNARKPYLRTRLKQEIENGVGIYVPSVILFELNYGITKSNRTQYCKNVLREFMSQPVTLVNFDYQDAEQAATIRAYLEARGTPIGPYDLLIAAQARRLGAVLVSDNRKEFERVPALMVTDWAN